jgi:hypothetical protein
MATSSVVPASVDDAEHLATARQMKADGHAGKDIARYLRGEPDHVLPLPRYRLSGGLVQRVSTHSSSGSCGRPAPGRPLADDKTAVDPARSDDEALRSREETTDDALEPQCHQHR